MSNIECATLILNSADLTTSQTQIGIKNASNTEQTWYNINVKDIVGQVMFDKYEQFNIILVENIMTVMTAGTTFPANNEKVSMLMMRGLNFRNATYSAVTKNQSGSACIGFSMATAMTTAIAVGQQYFNNNYNTFTKNSMNVDLTISMMKVNNGILATTTAGSFPDQSYIFKIYGITIPLTKV
jgi:hypothetical protein